MRPLLLLSLALTHLYAQEFRFSPADIQQGQALRVYAPAAAEKARLNGITIPLFPEPSGLKFGLMPIGVEDEPGEYKLEFLDLAGAILHEVSVTVHDARYSKQNIEITPALSQLRASTDEAARVKAFLSTASAVRFWEEPLRAPVSGCMNSPFGNSRLHNGKPTGDYHGGVDQHGAPGTPIHAVAAGTVHIARMLQLRGGTVGIDHGQGLESIYMHQSKIAAKEGQHVEAGDVIGYVGSTGRATGPHLHWSLYANGHSVNPLQWVKLTPCSAVAAPAKKKAAPPKKKK